VAKVAEVENSVRTALQGVGTFTNSDIEKQADMLQKKRLELERSITDLANFKTRATQIYQQHHQPPTHDSDPQHHHGAIDL
jgi:hypothetical protein